MVKSQRPSRRSSSVDRRRSRSRHNSVTSTSSSVLLDDNNYEMYSGAASEVIPSSISSLHYPHSFGNRRVSHISRETSPLLGTEEDDNDVRLHRVKSNVSKHSVDSQANFNFFTPDEIEMAQGGSTLENPEDPVDYNTNWDYSIDKYLDDEYQNELTIQDDEEPLSVGFYDQEGANSRFQSPEAPDYGSMEFERRNRRDSESSSKSASSATDSVASEQINVEFLKEFPAKLDYQRYYLAEEDLVLGIAGYKNEWWKKLLYYATCIFTFGLGYLILRWFPRYRVNLMGTRCALGTADWCVIENEFGELQIIDIQNKDFKRDYPVFLLASMKMGVIRTKIQLFHIFILLFTDILNFSIIHWKISLKRIQIGMIPVG